MTGRYSEAGKGSARRRENTAAVEEGYERIWPSQRNPEPPPQDTEVEPEEDPK